jgi:hypothetical protein
MANKGSWQATIVDSAGNVVPSATVTVRNDTPGQPLATIYSDREGVTPITNPTTADANGFVRFFADGGPYQIVATSGAFSRTWRYVPIGTANENDIEDYATANDLSSEVSALEAADTDLQASIDSLQNDSDVFYDQFNATKESISGFVISNSAGDPTNDIDVSAGAAWGIDYNYVVHFASAKTKRLDAAWAAGSGNGGLDTGSIANDTYHVFVIANDNLSNYDVLFSTSPTSPTMPANYVVKRRVGSFMRSGGAIVAFKSYGQGRTRTYYRNVPVEDRNTTNPGTSSLFTTLSIPTDVQFEAIVSISLRESTAGAGTVTYLLATSPDQTDTTPSSSVYNLLKIGNAGADACSSMFRIFTNTSAQIRTRVNRSGGDQIHTISTVGWVDYI